MPKFRKKPVVVEAEQWFPGKEVGGVVERARGTYGYMKASEGKHIVNAGDWVITRIEGEEEWRYPCSDVMFRAKYEPVEED